MKTKEYTIKYRRGMDDLRPEYAFRGNSQGDTSTSNSIKEYEASKGWMSFILDCPLKQEYIDLRIAIHKEWNRKYIEELRKQNKFGEEYEVTLKLVSNPLFDIPSLVYRKPISSYKIVFIE